MASSAGNILVIDDTLQNLKLLVDLLEDHSYKVRPAIDGELGLQAAKQEPPDSFFTSSDDWTNASNCLYISPT